MDKPLLLAVKGHRQARPPIWIMRQAGRYLPEYRKVRASVGSFLELCYTPHLAAEVSLQPLRRFDLDAAILFSDILVVPDALGQKVSFEAGDGPRLEPLTPQLLAELDADRVVARMRPVIETVYRVRSKLRPDKAVIGFCGGPWTVATYMICGRGSSDQAAAKLFALSQPQAFVDLMEVLTEASAEYLMAQIGAGADVVQIFESWALNLDDAQFADWVIAPNRRIVQKVRAKYPDAAIIGFPRGAHGMLAGYAREVEVDMVGLDYAMPPGLAGEILPKGRGVQGNLDPVRLACGGLQMERRAEEIVAAFADRPHVFNLGHGILPQTPVEHVERLVEVVKASGGNGNGADA